MHAHSRGGVHGGLVSVFIVISLREAPTNRQTHHPCHFTITSTLVSCFRLCFLLLFFPASPILVPQLLYLLLVLLFLGEMLIHQLFRLINVLRYC